VILMDRRSFAKAEARVEIFVEVRSDSVQTREKISGRGSSPAFVASPSPKNSSNFSTLPQGEGRRPCMRRGSLSQFNVPLSHRPPRRSPIRKSPTPKTTVHTAACLKRNENVSRETCVRVSSKFSQSKFHNTHHGRPPAIQRASVRERFDALCRAQAAGIHCRADARRWMAGSKAGHGERGMCASG
jgi:hypothetical protein